MLSTKSHISGAARRIPGKSVAIPACLRRKKTWWNITHKYFVHMVSNCSALTSTLARELQTHWLGFQLGVLSNQGLVSLVWWSCFGTSVLFFFHSRWRTGQDLRSCCGRGWGGGGGGIMMQYHRRYSGNTFVSNSKNGENTARVLSRQDTFRAFKESFHLFFSQSACSTRLTLCVLLKRTRQVDTLQNSCCRYRLLFICSGTQKEISRSSSCPRPSISFKEPIPLLFIPKPAATLIQPS